MKNFEELAFEWYDTICFSDKYAYRTEKMNAIKHLVSFFGKMNCEAIKSADVDRFIKYESEHLNPNNGKPYSKKIMIRKIYALPQYAAAGRSVSGIGHELSHRPQDA